MDVLEAVIGEPLALMRLMRAKLGRHLMENGGG